MDRSDPIEVSDETWLWRAVLARALDDARNTKPVAGTKSTGGRPTIVERDEARRFLLSQIEPWREDRRLVCALAGYSVEVVERRAREILNPLIAAERERDAEHVESDDERQERESLATHLELGGALDKRITLRRRVEDAPLMAAE